MIRNTLLALIAVSGLAIFAKTQSSSRTGDAFLGGPAVYTPDGWSEYNFQEVGPTRAASYDFTFKVTGKKDALLRVAFDRQDETNYYFAELTSTGLRLGRVEEGFESTLDATETVRVEPGATSDCRLKRRGERMSLSFGGRVVLQAAEQTFTNGTIHLGTPNKSVDVPSARIQPAGEMFFADDFMRPGDEMGEWEVVVGEWRVKSLDNPSLSANAFTFEGHSSGRPATAVAGYSFWDSYTFKAAVSGRGCGDIGLIFYANDFSKPNRIGDYYVFRWSPEDAENDKQNECQLVHVKNGEHEVLAEADGGYRSTQWYELKVSVNNSRIKAFIDGRTVFDLTDENAVGGKFGLYSWCNHPGCPLTTSFDDVLVTKTEDYQADFENERIADWKTFGGEWQSVDGVMECKAARNARAVTGDSDWKNYRVSADVEVGESEWVGLIAGYRDEGEHLLYRVSPLGRQQLVRFSEGVETVIQEKSGLPPRWQPGANTLEVKLNTGVLTASANEVAQFQAWLGPGIRGLAGLYAAKTERAAFDNVDVSHVESNNPVLNVNPVFAREKSMANWAAADSDWPHAGTVSEPGAYLTSHVHRMEFFDDVQFTVNAERIETLRKLRLSIGTDSGTQSKGYHFSIEPYLLNDAPPSFDPSQSRSDESTNIAWKAVMYHRNEKLVEKQLEGTTPSDLSFRRDGNLYVGYVNSEQILKYQADAVPEGSRIAYAFRGGRIQPSKTKVVGKSTWCYSFREATADWRIGSGHWEVTNRWQCDPRWTFFAGYDSQLASIWNKREFGDDLCVDLAAGIKMDRNRGNRYEYASDLNITVGGDGKDFSSGYGFMFGADNNRGTYITRNGVIVAQRARTIPIHTNIHRVWFHLKVVKRGGQLSYYINDQLELSYDDPNPLRGKQVGLWTWNNGIMVAQVRMSGKSSGMEDPSRKLRETPYCYYSLPRE